MAIIPVSPAPRSLPERIEAWCALAVEQAAVDGAGVSVLSAGGTPDPVHATDELSTLVEDLQFTLGVGPCFDAVTRGEPVLVSDLADPHGQALVAGWQAFLDEAVSAGIRGVFAFPLGAPGACVGTLDLYRSASGPLSSDGLRRTQATAGAIGSALLSGGASSTEALEHVRHRAAVHQAAGMVMVQMDVGIDEALLLLRATAYAEGASINAVADSVVAGRRRFSRDPA